MTPTALHAALAAMPARSAQVLHHRLIDAKSREACAALYGLTVPQWDLLFLRAAHDLERTLGRTPTAPETADEAARLAQALTPELEAIHANRDELLDRMARARAAYEASPAFERETWGRRMAIIVILALTAYFYWRQEMNTKPVPYAPYLTVPKKPPNPR